MAARAAAKQYVYRPQPAALQRQTEDERDPALEQMSPNSSLIGLQRAVGNRGVQRLMQTGGLQAAGLNLIHRKSCSCPSCSGALARGAGEAHIQREGDEEEESSWWDQATQAASNTWDAASDAVGEAAGGAYDAVNEASGGLVGDVADAAEGAYDKWNEYTSDPEDGPVDAPRNEASESETEEEVETPSDVSSDDEGWQDWMPDWWQDEDENDEAEGSEEVVYANESDYESETDEDESSDGGASGGAGACVSGHGGHHGNITVEGRTTANFGEANCPANFTPTAKKRNPRGGWDVTGTMHISFSLPEPTIRFFVKPPESELTQCELEAVLGYINGDLSTHEDEHVKAFKLFNGEKTFTHTFGNLDGANNTELQESLSAAIDGLVASEIQERQENAQRISDGLDPFAMEIPGLNDCSYFDDNPQE